MNARSYVTHSSPNHSFRFQKPMNYQKRTSYSLVPDTPSSTSTRPDSKSVNPSEDLLDKLLAKYLRPVPLAPTTKIPSRMPNTFGLSYTRHKRIHHSYCVPTPCNAKQNYCKNFHKLPALTPESHKCITMSSPETKNHKERRVFRSRLQIAPIEQRTLPGGGRRHYFERKSVASEKPEQEDKKADSMLVTFNKFWDTTNTESPTSIPSGLQSFRIETPIKATPVKTEEPELSAFADTVQKQMISKVPSKDSVYSFSAKQTEDCSRNPKEEIECIRKYTKSPTFDSLFKDAETPKMATKMSEAPVTLSPKSKREIMRLFSIPKSVKKRRLQKFLLVFFLAATNTK